MKIILLLGAGLSSSSLIRYLLDHAEQEDWFVNVVDQDLSLAQRKIGNHPRAAALSFNALDPAERKPMIGHADIVISMLPARFHAEVAVDCIELKTHLITPSYVSPEMKALAEHAVKAGIVIMNEIGVDPGIDHMSAMQIIHDIQAKGGKMDSFKSFCGGLMAPESDDNPWHFKFTWNPRNVVLAGQGGAAAFIQNNENKYIPYSQLFKRTERFEISTYGEFDGYANRDSFAYRKTYGLLDIPTLYRGTLRRPDFCQGWNVFIELGMTDDSYKLSDSNLMTPRRFINSFLPYYPSKSVEEKFKEFLGPERTQLFDQFNWLGIFNNEEFIGLENASPAKLLEEFLIKKLILSPNDKDMIVMYHEFEYSIENKKKKVIASMVNIGEDPMYTSMANTVGLPVAIMAKLILQEKFNTPGVHIPIQPEVYNPIMEELKSFGILFHEVENDL